MSDIYEVINAFDFGEKIISVKEFGSGHINSTFLVDTENGKYVVQRINTNVFKKPDELMENIFSVTSFLKKEIEKTGGDTKREVLNFIKTKDLAKYYTAKDGECFRAYLFVKDSVCYDKASIELFKKSGEAFGKFQNMLGAFNAESLFETIPNFHNTQWRYENEFLPALNNADKEKLAECSAEIDYIKSQKERMKLLNELCSSGVLPLRVTHNDTKLNNVLFDVKTGDSLAVIDLDTVMPGLALYDFGDSIRFGASMAAEDESDLEKVRLDLDYFKAYTEGYLSYAGKTLNETELEYLPFSCYMITLELAMRFLSDYLCGSVYFKTDYEKHNLIRARNQLTLAKDIFLKLDDMKKIISEYT